MHISDRRSVPHQLAKVGLSLFAHAFELGPLLLRHELTAFLVPLRVGLFPHRLGRELRTLFHGTLASVVPDRLVCRHDVHLPVLWWKLTSPVLLWKVKRTTLGACPGAQPQSKLLRLLAAFSSSLKGSLRPPPELGRFRWPNSQCRTPDVDHSQQRARCAPPVNACPHVPSLGCFQGGVARNKPPTRLIRTVAGTT